MTRWPALTVIVPRVFYGAVVALAGVYAILSYVPFVYTQFIKQDFIPALAWFARLFPVFFLAALGVLAYGMKAADSGWKRRHRIFIGAHAAAGLGLAVFPLRSLQDNLTSLIAGLLFFGSLLWVAALDLAGSGPAVDWRDADQSDGAEANGLTAFLATAVFLTLSFCAAAWLRASNAGGGAGLEPLLILGSAFAHTGAAMIAFTILLLVCGLAGAARRQGPAQFVIFGVTAALASAGALARFVLAAISLTGWPGLLISLWAAAAATAYLFAMAARAASGERPQSGVGLGVSALSLGLARRRAGGAVLVAAGFAGTLAVGFYIPQRDYSLVLQQAVTLIVWVTTFCGFYALVERRGRRNRAGLQYAAALLGLGCFLAWTAWAPASAVAALPKYRGLDISYSLAETLLGPAAAAGGDSGNFFAFLEKHTNIPSTTAVKPVDITMSEVPANSASFKPHIFIIVVDSLRRDYLSPYNPKVTFTPRVEEFARDSIVMRNSFTRYGATGLSEPSIWTGGMLIHKQYVLPFHPMNALEKLVEQEGYRAFVSRDTILDIILKKDSSMTNIDAGVPNRDYRLCDSLGRLTTLLENERPGPPIFAYTQPQDIHVSVINRENRSVPAGESYAGFDAAYASRLRRMDACFGAFLDHLKDRGMYENSVVVLTADHGDSLGEGGRYGHAYTLFPEVMKIPLIVHVPAALRNRLQWDDTAVAFQTDITPSLYYLLGRRPVRNENLGRPLLTGALEEQKDYLQDQYVLASSYGPVWGILRNNGRYLYVADGVNYADYYYDLSADPAGNSSSVSASIRAEYRALIERDIHSLDTFYQLDREP